jgi:ABC-type transporter Mla subunit MlaD
MLDPREHTERRNFIETILRYIPGFRGYLEKEYRRESDELQRNWLADRLQRAKRAIDEVSRSLADAAQLDALPQLDRLRGRLDKLIGRIRGAMQGYSGFFDLVRVDVPLLDRVYAHDVDLVQAVDQLAQAVEQLPPQQDKLAAALPAVMGKVDEIAVQWDLREGILKGLE